MTYDNRNDDHPLDTPDALLSAVEAITHRQLEYWYSNRYDDLLLEVLTSLHRDDEAERLALMRDTPSEQYRAMITIYWVKLAQDRVTPADTQTLQSLINLIEDPAERAFAPQMIPAPHNLPEDEEVMRKIKLPDDRPAYPYEIALEMVRELRDEPRTKVLILARVASIMARVGQTSEAMSVFGEAIGIARDIETLKDRAQALRRIVQFMMDCHAYPEALTTLMEVLNLERLEENRFCETRALGEIVKLLCERGDIATANAIARDTQDESRNKYALVEIAVELAKQGKTSEALAITESIYDLRGLSLHRIATLLAERGEIAESIRIARMCRDKGFTLETLSDVGLILEQQGRTEEASGLWEEALSIQAEMGEPDGGALDSYKGEVLSHLAQALVKRGDTEGALAILPRIKPQNYQESALLQIVTNLAESGRVDEAWEIARKLRYRKYRRWAFEDIAGALAKQARYREALDVFPLHNPSDFLRFIIGWRDSLPAAFFNRVLKSVLLILTSELPQWQRILELGAF